MTSQSLQKKYEIVGLGGTFDHFHLGHAWFLREAAKLAARLVIGITTPAMLEQKEYANSLESYDQRSASVRLFLTKQGIPHELVPLTNVAGPAVTDQRLQAVVLTEETVRGGNQINELRTAAGFAPLPLEIVPLYAQNKLLSSRLIRAGVINRQGSLYADLLETSIRLNNYQREQLRQVQGTVVTSPDKSDWQRYVVGDSTLKRFLNEEETYALAVIDGKEQRREYSPLVIEPSVIDLVVVNPAGMMTRMMTSGLQLALRKQLVHVYVDGEEDLAAVVLQLILPLGAVIYYGQPKNGLVRWPVSEAAKEAVAVLLDPHFQTNPKLVE